MLILTNNIVKSEVDQSNDSLYIHTRGEKNVISYEYDHHHNLIVC